MAGQLAGSELEICREERGIAGSQTPVQVPRVALEWCLEAAGQVGLVDIALGDAPSDPLDAGLVRAALDPRPEDDRAWRVRLGWLRVRTDRSDQPCVDAVEPADQAEPVAVERPSGEPGVARAPIPGHDPVIEREPERRQVLIGRGDRRQMLEGC